MGALSQRHRVIAFDRSGFGHGERPAAVNGHPKRRPYLLQQALLQLGVERPVVVGHSGGALVALGMALKSPAGRQRPSAAYRATTIPQQGWMAR